MKNKLILLISVLIGICAFWMSKAYLQKMHDKMFAGSRKVKVIAAQHDLAPGTVIQMEDLGTLEVFESTVGRNAFRVEDRERLIGRTVRYQVSKHSALLWSQVDVPRSGFSEFATSITKGMRAVSLSISGAPAVSGLVQRNDHVDILGTFTLPDENNALETKTVTLTLLQNVMVLATGSEYGQYGQSQSRGYSSVTFELTPDEAEIAVFAQQARGQLYLTLRNPEDIRPKSDLESVNFEYIEDTVKKLKGSRNKPLLQ